MSPLESQSQLQFVARARRSSFGYMFWITLGLMGAHNFYIGRQNFAIAQIVLTLSALSFLVTGLILIGVDGSPLELNGLTDTEPSGIADQIEMVAGQIEMAATEAISTTGLVFLGVAAGILLLLFIWLAIEGLLLDARIRMYNRNLAAKLVEDPEARQLMQTVTKIKSVAVAYLLWIIVSHFSGHNFYLGRREVAIAQLILTFLGPLIVVRIVWQIVELFFIPGWTAEYNAELIRSQLGSQAPQTATADDSH